MNLVFSTRKIRKRLLTLACAGIATASLNTNASASNTVVLFDGKSLAEWKSSANGSPARWLIRDGYMEVLPGSGDIETKQHFGDFKLHLEFWLPKQPHLQGAARGNSGIYLQSRYELQILDSFENPTDPKHSCGALYDMIPPVQLAGLPPEQWQTYDVTFRAPKLDEAGNVSEAGSLTVVHNGVVIHDNARFDSPTLGGAPLQATPGPIRLQDHANRIRFRNITVEEL